MGSQSRDKWNYSKALAACVHLADYVTTPVLCLKTGSTSHPNPFSSTTHPQEVYPWTVSLATRLPVNTKPSWLLHNTRLQVEFRVLNTSAYQAQGHSTSSNLPWWSTSLLGPSKSSPAHDFQSMGSLHNFSLQDSTNALFSGKTVYGTMSTR